MSPDIWIKLGPLLGGAVLFAICAFNMIRNPGVSNGQAILLAFGGLLFAIPTFTSINFKSAAFEFSGQVATPVQVATQGAEIKSELTVIRQVVEALAKASGSNTVVATTAATATAEAEKNRGSLVFIIYTSEQKTLAQRLETVLLRKGYAANAVFSDFSELDASQKGQSGEIRFVYPEKNKALATALKNELGGQIPPQKVIADRVVDKLSADTQIQLF